MSRASAVPGACAALALLLAGLAACGDPRPEPAPARASAAPAPNAPVPPPAGEATPAAAAAASGPPATDPQSGFIVDARTPLVVATCTGCHSAKLVTQNRGTRRDWEERLRWMQKNHNLWALEGDVRNTILDYLSEHYAPEQPTGQLRRAPLPAYLLPPPAAQPGAAKDANS